MYSVLIDIAGSTYQLKTDEDPEYVQNLANLVTVKILEIKRDTGASAVDCATMAALDFADRLTKEQQKKKPASRKRALPDLGEEPATLL